MWAHYRKYKYERIKFLKCIKAKTGFKERPTKGIKTSLKKIKTNRASFANMLADDTKVFLKKKKRKSASFAQSNIKIFLKMKQKQVDYRRNYYIHYITLKR